MLNVTNKLKCVTHRVVSGNLKIDPTLSRHSGAPVIRWESNSSMVSLIQHLQSQSPEARSTQIEEILRMHQKKLRCVHIVLKVHLAAEVAQVPVALQDRN